MQFQQKMRCCTGSPQEIEEFCGKLKKFEDDCLMEHNNLRALHGCPPLRKSKRLRKVATDWAKYLAEINEVRHRPLSNFGENIFWAYNMSITGITAVKSWYDECKKYDYISPGYSPNTGHFTQVVWRNTEKMGIGLAIEGRIVWVVVNYYPSGNIKGEFFNNVPLPLLEQSTDFL